MKRTLWWSEKKSDLRLVRLENTSQFNDINPLLSRPIKMMREKENNGKKEWKGEFDELSGKVIRG